MIAAYLESSLLWLDALLDLRIQQIRLQRRAAPDDEFRGLYISEEEVDALLAPSPGEPPQLQAARERVARASAVRAAAAQAEPAAALLRLQRLFDLHDIERDLLLVALAPEIDLRYERLFAYAQDDVTRRHPSVDLALSLLCADRTDRLAARALFDRHAPLRRLLLITLFEDGQRHAPLLGQCIKLDPRISAELLGQPVLDERLHGCVNLAPPLRSLDDLVLPPDLVAQLRSLALSHQRDEPLVIALIGSYGTGRQQLAAALCAEIDSPLVAANIHSLAGSALPPEEAAARVLREARLRGGAALLTGAEALLGDDQPETSQHAWMQALDQQNGLVFLASERSWEPRGALRRATYVQIELPQLSYGERERLWRAQLNGSTPGDRTIETLASAFRLSGGQIRDAIRSAHGRARAAGPGAPVTPEHLFAGARAQSSDTLGQLARRVVTPYSWADIVLPADQLGMLREITATLRHRRTVYEAWGFDRKLASGKGLVVLFAGPSGTGKTMAASIIARDLGLDLYAIDLASVVSKYIGETEKNLDRIFDAARRSNAVLFFDEADSVFGKRSEVKDAHDRYANIEVGYLLQKMESHDGVVVLATNLRKNMDDAFVRRLHYAIEFPFPEEQDRLRIWQGVFPPEAPLTADVDLAFLARRFKLAGGNIRNIALAAAFMAAEDGTSIGMVHLVRATRREYQKIGKLVTEADFGQYLSLARS